MGLVETGVELLTGRRPVFNNAIFTSGESTRSLAARSFGVSSPASKKTTPELPRANKSSLELAYLKDPTVFNVINKTSQMILSAGYVLVGDSKSVNFFETFFEEIGSRGGETEWEEMLSSIFKYQMIYGDAWVELLFSKKNKDIIVDLELIDPKTMDYAKDSGDKIVFDNNGNPVGYVQTLPPEYSVTQKYAPPESVSLQYNQIFFPPEVIAHFKLYTVGDRLSGIGLIEPSLKTINYKVELKSDHANSIRRSAFPIKDVEVGDAMHEPTEELVQRSMEQIKNLEGMSVIARPHWVKINYLESKHPESLHEILEYYDSEFVSGSGLPQAFATGKGEATNRSTLNRQEALSRLTTKEIVRRGVRTIENKIIKPVAKSNKVNPVKIVWGELSIEDLDGRAKRLTEYVKAGLLKPTPELEILIRQIENLPEMKISEDRDIRGKADKPKVVPKGKE